MYCVVIRFADSLDVFEVVTGFTNEDQAIAWAEVFRDASTEDLVFTVMQPTDVSEIKLK